MQATETLALQPIAAGRYHDAFERFDGVWRISLCDYSMLDAIGDVRCHLNTAAEPGA